jgi:hypothetical protein
MSVSTPKRNRARVSQLRPRPAIRQVHVRLAPQELDLIEDVAEELGVPVSPAIRLLVGLGIEARRAPVPVPTGPADTQAPTEMLLHLLVATEQVLALIESFLPEGPGAADAALPAAAFAAQRRLAAGEPAPPDERI